MGKKPQHRLRVEFSVIVGLLLFCISACATGQSAGYPERTAVDDAILRSQAVSAFAIRSKSLFRHFADTVAGERFVKFVVDLKTGKMIYFNVRKYPMHTDYVFAQIYKKSVTPEGLADVP